MARREKKVKSSVLTALMARKAKCKFTQVCNLYSSSSYTCAHVGGKYCGKYRALSDEPKEDLKILVNKDLTEDLIQ